ncbi:MAG: MBL fold metallo-hydrolase [Desulfobacteraceae bacterium]|nr:MBL fold metallo-hydrolase [Desulfobacteraceae bacterium]
MEKIHPRVFRIPASFTNIEVNLYLIQGERLALIDTGVSNSVERFIKPALNNLGFDLKDLDLIIHTHAHFDHN